MTQPSGQPSKDVAPDTLAGLFAFPSAEQLDESAGLFPYARTAITSARWRRLNRVVRWGDVTADHSPGGHTVADGSTEFRGFKDGVFAKLDISPGAVKLHRRNDAQADRLRTQHAHLRELRKSGTTAARPFTKAVAIVLGEWADDDHFSLCPRPLTKQNAIFLGEWSDDTFNRVTGWSSKSQNALKLAVSQLDLAELVNSGDPVMITYTLPGDWLGVTPDAATASRIWNHYRTLWTRTFKTPPRCIWKREFQRRGAPHWHEWTVLPPVPADHAKNVLVPFAPTPHGARASWSHWLRETISELWTAAVFGQDATAAYADCNGTCELDAPVSSSVVYGFVCRGCERARNRRVGTNISYSKGATARDPRRLATYFLKESQDSENKSYQNLPPRQWGDASVGRYWGVRGIERAVTTIDIDPLDADALWRVMRKLRESQRRADRRRIKVRSRGGFVLVNDGALIASQLAQFVTDLRREPAPGSTRDRDRSSGLVPNPLRSSTAATRYAMRKHERPEGITAKEWRTEVQPALAVKSPSKRRRGRNLQRAFAWATPSNESSNS